MSTVDERQPLDLNGAWWRSILMDVECERTGLSMATCHHCKGVDLPEAINQRGTTRNYPSDRKSNAVVRPPEVLIAHRDYRPPCLDCGGQIRKGNRVRYSTTGLMMHEICPSQARLG